MTTRADTARILFRWGITYYGRVINGRLELELYEGTKPFGSLSMAQPVIFVIDGGATFGGFMGGAHEADVNPRTSEGFEFCITADGSWVDVA